MVPIWALDFAGNVTILAISVYIVIKVLAIIRMRPNTPLWVYMEWQVVGLLVFATSHSVGHIVKRVLILAEHRDIWEQISPITGSINSLSFVVVGILSFLYKDIETASERMGALEDAKIELELTAGKLRDSYRRMELDAEEITLKNKDLSVLNRIAVAASKSLEMDHVMGAIVKEVRDYLGVEFLALYLLNDSIITLKLAEGMSVAFMEKAGSRSMTEPWLKRTVMAGETFFAQERPEEHTGKIDKSFKSEGVQAWAAVPLMAKGKVVGVLTVGSSKYDGIDTRHIDTLSTIGGYVGVVIENSMLFEDSKQKLDDLERFRRFSVGREMRIIELKDRLKGLDKGSKKD